MRQKASIKKIQKEKIFHTFFFYFFIILRHLMWMNPRKNFLKIFKTKKK